MKKNVKNDKVLRAITIGLATMIAATSAPVTAFAEEGEGAAETSASPASSESSSSEGSSESGSSENGSSESSESTSQSENTSTPSQIAGDCVELVANEVPAAEAAVEVAAVAVSAIDPATEVIDPDDAQIVTDIQHGLDDVAADIAPIGGEEGNLAVASAAIGEALVDDLIAEKAVETAEEKLDTAKTERTNFNNAKKDTTDDANSAIDNADLANTSNSEPEAYQAKVDAEADLAQAKEGLEAATEAYKKSGEAVDKADKEYQIAVEEQAKANAKLEEAKDALADANTNATAANERMKALQSQMDNLNQKVEDLAKQKEDLEKLNEQYYKLMVHFYRDKNIASANYDENGQLDIEKSAQAFKDSGKATTTLTENTYRVGRALMAELIEFKLKTNGVDPSTIHIGDEETKKPQYYDEGTLTKDNNNNDRVTVVDETKYSAEERAEWEKEHTIYFSAYGKGVNGTANSVKVTYTVTDEDGNEKVVTEYYNYEIKGRSANDTLDFENGPIYLAQIDGENVTRDTDANNMDDLRNLNKRIEEAMKAAQILDDYNEAKAAVDEAQRLVDDLTSAIDTLNQTELKISDEKVKALETALTAAKEDLKTAEGEKKALEEKVSEAQAAVDSIDLSRFNKKPAPAPAPAEDPEEDPETDPEADPEPIADPEPETDPEPIADPDPETDPTPAPAPVPAVVNPVSPSTSTPDSDSDSGSEDRSSDMTVSAPIVLPAIDFIPTLDQIAPVVPSTVAFIGGAQESAVAGARVEEASEDQTGDEVRPIASTKPVVAKKDIKKANGKLVRLEDNEVPLAAMPVEDGIEMSWWWILIIALLGATGKAMYENHKQKVEAKKAQNIDR